MHLGTVAVTGAPSSTTAGSASPTVVVPATAFSDGLMLWKSPGEAVKSFSSLGTMYTLHGMGYTAGFLLPPLALVGVALMVMAKKGKG